MAKVHMDDRRGTGPRVRLSVALLAAAFAFPRDGFAQAIDIAPLVTPPVQKVLPTPSPEVLPPAPPSAPALEAIPPGPAVHVDDVRLEGFTVYDANALRPFYADLVGTNVPREKLLAVVDALQTRYREDGYVLTTVHGAAEHKNGRLVFVIRATEGYISSVKLDAAGEIGSVGSLALDILNHLTAVGPVATPIWSATCCWSTISRRSRRRRCCCRRGRRAASISSRKSRGSRLACNFSSTIAARRRLGPTKRC